MPEASAGWTYDRVVRLKKLWSEGLSCSQIAADLGGVTRNAVVGKAHRLGLNGRSTSNLPRLPKIKREPGNQFGLNGGKPFDKSKDVDGIKIVSRFDKAPLPPICLKIPLAKLENNSCRFPLGNPADRDTFAFCGVPEADMSDGKPYCNFHSRLCFISVSQRRADREREGKTVPINGQNF